MANSAFIRPMAAAALSISALLVVRLLQRSLTLGDLLVIAAASGLVVSVFASIFRGPKQFASAVFERVRYAIIVPVCALLMIGLLIFRIGFIFFKLSIKVVIAAIAAIAYVVMPIDLVPDFILGLGQLDDISIVGTLAIWAVSMSMNESLVLQDFRWHAILFKNNALRDFLSRNFSQKVAEHRES